MTVEPFVPDTAPFSDGVRENAGARGDAGAFARALDAIDGLLNGASRAEDAFAYGTGTLQAAVYERARADAALSVATASAARIAQSVQSILNMQV